MCNVFNVLAICVFLCLAYPARNDFVVKYDGPHMGHKVQREGDSIIWRPEEVQIAGVRSNYGKSRGSPEYPHL